MSDPVDPPEAYQFRRLKRAKRLRITIRPDGSVLLTAPWRVSKKMIESFWAQHRPWVRQEQQRCRQQLRDPDLYTRARYYRYREPARRLVAGKAASWARFYGLSYGRISIRDQRSRWGSCSGQGNLNFSYRIYFLPPRLQDYLVVHEICHLRELNHSPEFWALVAQALPDYPTLRSELSKLGPI